MNKHFSSSTGNHPNNGKAGDAMNLLNRENISRTKRKTCGFTLIELLVTIAIIAILAGVLLPALNAARGKAIGIQCVGNMKQVGLQVLMYADSADGFWPISKATALQSGNWSREVMQTATLTSPLPKYFFCPANRFTPAAANPDPYAGVYTYGIRTGRWNMDLGTEAMLPFVNKDGSALNSPGGAAAFNSRKIKRPSGYQMITDSVCYDTASAYSGKPFYNVNDSSSGYHLIHQGRATVLLVDGHVESWSGAKTAEWVIVKGGRGAAMIRRENFQISY